MNSPCLPWIFAIIYTGAMSFVLGFVLAYVLLWRKMKMGRKMKTGSKP